MRFPRPVLLACLLAVLAAALPAAAQDVPPPEAPRMAAGVADRFHGPGAFVRLACSAACDFKGEIRVTKRMRKFLKLKSRTVGKGSKHLDGPGSIDVLVALNNSAIRAVRAKGGDRLPVRVSGSATDDAGRTAKLRRKKLRIPL